MKKSFKITGALLFALLVTATWSFAANGKNDQPYLVKEFSLDRPGNLLVETSGGSIKVYAHQSNKVRVEMYLRKNGKELEPGDAEAREMLENYSIDISKVSDQVSAKAEKNSGNWFNSGNQNSSISFTVYVPYKMTADLKTSGGSISMEGVYGNHTVKTSGGSLHFFDIQGNMNASTSGGSIHVEKYAGVLDAHTSGGSINLQDSEGDLKLHTSGGGIKIYNVKGSVDASTSGGGINANLITLTNSLRLHTSGGSINAIVPAGLGLDLDLKGNRVNTKLYNFNGEAEKNRIVGSMNGGGIPVVMSTSGGSVNLEYQ